MSRLEKIRHSPVMILVIVCFGLFVEQFLYGMIVPLTSECPAHIIDEHTVSELYGAYALGLIIATPILGIITERTGRKRPMILGAIFLAISAVLFWLGANREMLIIARLLQGAAAACTWTAGLALVAGYFVADRVKAMGYAMIGATSGIVVGPVVGGAIYEKFGYNAPYYFIFALIAIDTAFRFLIPATSRVQTLSAWKETFVELGGIVTDKSVLSAAFAVSLAAASWALMEPIFPMHMVKIAKATPTMIGGAFTFSNLLYAFMAPVVGWISDRIGVRHTTVLGLVVTALVLPLQALAPNFIIAGLFLCLMSVGFALTLNPTSAELGDAVDRRGSTSYSVAYAIYNLSYSFGMLAADFYVQFVTDAAHKLELLQIMLIVSGMFLLCVPLFLGKEPTREGAAATAIPIDGI